MSTELRPPSRTALGAAAHRAAHQILDQRRIFSDPFASTILGGAAIENPKLSDPDDKQRSLRLFIAARSRFAEDCLSAAVSRGVQQAVVLGAGLDTFGLRNPHAHLGLRLFEVDHPASQNWKRERLDQTGLVVPASLVFAPIDFERENLADGLRAAGFDSGRSAFFIWLGVIPYLTRTAVAATFDFIATVPEAEVVFDYSEPLESYPPERRASVAALGARTAAIGEPWLTHFDPAELSRMLRQQGFEHLEDLTMSDIFTRFFETTQGERTGAGPHVMRARRHDPPETNRP